MKGTSLTRRTDHRTHRVRILLICEGKKTEPHYFEEFWTEYRHPNVEVCALHGDHTDPQNLVTFGQDIFLHGGDNGHGKKMLPRAFDEVYILFDRDEHPSYAAAIQAAENLEPSLRNDFKKHIVFKALPSNPCFELWLVLHYKEVLHLPHRDDLFDDLKQRWNGYDKGATGLFAKTKDLLPDACTRATKLNAGSSPYNEEKGYAGVLPLVERLQHLHQKYTQESSRATSPKTRRPAGRP